MPKFYQTQHASGYLTRARGVRESHELERARILSLREAER
jgi:hypothetical protein